MIETRTTCFSSGQMVDFLQALPEYTQTLSEADTGRLMLALAAHVRGDAVNMPDDESGAVELLYNLFTREIDYWQEHARHISEVRRAAGAQGGRGHKRSEV